MHNETSDPVRLLSAARTGDGAALGDLLGRYRGYLKILARLQIGAKLRGKAGSSDLLQETFVEAHRNLGLFRGTTEAEFAAWLRQILAGRLALLFRRYLGTRGRDVRMERELTQELNHSSMLLDRAFVAPGSSPSGEAARRERALLLAGALERLPDRYREVIVLRHLGGLGLTDIARRLRRTEDSVQKLWVRGLAELRRVLGDEI